MSLSNAFENDLALLLFNNTSIANVGDATGIVHSTTAGNLYVALHTADPGEAGDQSTSEASYTGYARVAVARSSAGWTVSGSAPTTVNPAANITFGNPTSGQTLTHFSIGVASSGATRMLGSGALTSSIVVTNGGAAPVLNTATSITLD